MANKITVTVERITPQKAEEMLGKNSHNRTPRGSAVSKYAGAMARGEWVLNGEAVKISEKGDILDGQHRLMAVLESDTAVDMLVIRGLESGSQETMDQGVARTLGDVLKLRGEPNAGALAATVRMVWAFEKYGIPNVSAGGAWSPTTAQALDALERHPGIRESMKVTNGATQYSWLVRTFAAAMHYIFSQVDREDADQFMHQLITGVDLEENSPIGLLRDRLIREYSRQDRRPLTVKVKAAFTVRSWNAWRNGEELSKLQWKGGGANPSKFPLVDGLNNNNLNKNEQE
jgi:hypothetical protein